MVSHCGFDLPNDEWRWASRLACLMMNDDECLSLDFLATWVCSLGKCLLKLVVQFWIRLFLLSCAGSLYSLDTRSLSETRFENIFSQSVNYFPILDSVFGHKFKVLMASVSVSVSCASGPLPHPRLYRFTPAYILLRALYSFSSNIRSLIHWVNFYIWYKEQVWLYYFECGYSLVSGVSVIEIILSPIE